VGEPRHLSDSPIFGNEDQEDYCQKIETFSKILFYVFYHDYAMAERLGSDVPYDGIASCAGTDYYPNADTIFGSVGTLLKTLQQFQLD
jgi:hypothetical protein